MAEIRRIVCFASSRKVSGRCIAGKDIESGQWLRPVSARPSGEISEKERRYEDGTQAHVLDLIDIPVLGPAVSGHPACALGAGRHDSGIRRAWVRGRPRVSLEKRRFQPERAK
jgi:hypothetical protein